MLDKVRLALRITSRAYDKDLEDLIAAALDDLGIAGIDKTQTNAPLLQRAVVTYCRAHFGSPADYDRLKSSYDEQKAQLQMASGFTDWGHENAQV